MKKVETLHCSFCGKSQHEASKLIAGPRVFICDECVDLCNEIVADPVAGAKFASDYRRRKEALKLALERAVPGEPDAATVQRAVAIEAYLFAGAPTAKSTTLGLTSAESVG